VSSLDPIRQDGVVYKRLGEVASYSNSRVEAIELDETNFVGVDNLLPNRRGKTNAIYRSNTARLTRYEIGDILLGNIRPYLKKVWRATDSGGCSGDVLAVRISSTGEPTLISEFVYYLLSSDEFFAYNMRHAKGAKMPRGSKEAILKFRIPIPPVSVQWEIVRMLDTFAELERELEAELEARRLQLSHYRQSLLLDDSLEPGRWGTLSEIGKVSMCKRIFKHETSALGEVPFYKIGTFGGQPDAYISRAIYEKYRGQYPFPRRGEVLLSAAGTIGRAIPFDGADAYFQDSNIVWLANDESVVLNRYLFHWYQLAEWSTDGGTIQRLYNDNLRRTPIRIPSLEGQARIVETLDKLDALVNSPSFGLPAEISARAKQYEYYRAKLLTFKEKVA